MVKPDRLFRLSAPGSSRSHLFWLGLVRSCFNCHGLRLLVNNDESEPGRPDGKVFGDTILYDKTEPEHEDAKAKPST